MQDSKHTVTWEVKPWEKGDLEAASGWVPRGCWLFGEYVGETLLWLSCFC